MDCLINGFDKTSNPYTRLNAKDGRFGRIAEVTEAEPSISGEDRVTISHAARRMREEADKESEVTMIGSIDSSLRGTERAYRHGHAGKPTESFDQCLGNAAKPEDDKTGEQAAAKPEDVQASEQAAANAALPEDDKASEQAAAKPEDAQASEQAVPDWQVVPDWVANHVNPDDRWKLRDDAMRDFGCSPLAGGVGGLSFLLPGDPGDKYEYYGLVMQCHNEVVKEMNIDLSKYGSPESLSTPEAERAIREIYNRVRSLPRAQELLQSLGYTKVTEWGVPYHPHAISGYKDETDEAAQGLPASETPAQGMPAGDEPAATKHNPQFGTFWDMKEAVRGAAKKTGQDSAMREAYLKQWAARQNRHIPAEEILAAVENRQSGNGPEKRPTH
jgi:hypothetical protein